MNKTEIENMVYNDIVSRKHEAEHQAEVRYYKALQNADFERIDKSIRSAIIEKARVEFDNGQASAINGKIKKLKDERTQILKKMNMTLEDIRPKYSCQKCKDTGFVGNTRCSCFQNAINDALFENSNLSKNMNRTFKDFDVNLYDDVKFAKNLLTLGKNIVKEGGNFRSPIVLLQGKVGAGKTFFLECLSNELLQAGVAIVFMPAFELSQKLIEWHLGTLEEKMLLQQALIDCDVLVIDDLGTEPIYKNVSAEYLQNIIDFRIIKNKLTLISTNLNNDDFHVRYGDRLSSRIYMNDNILKLEINNSDLRVSKKS